MGDFGEGVDIVRWVRKMTSDMLLADSSVSAAVMAVADGRLPRQPVETIVFLFRVAMLCVQENSAARPTMREVVQLLTGPHCSQPPDLLSL